MKKWTTAWLMLVLCAVGASASSIDTWDMNNNGEFQISDHGINLGTIFSTNNQQVAQIPDDGSYILSPTSTPGYTGQELLSSTADLTSGLVSLSWTISAVDFSTTPLLNTEVGFRLWNSDATKYVGLAIYDNGDKMFCRMTTESAYNKGFGQIFTSLSGTGARTITLDLDYANSQISLSNDNNWTWNGSGGLADAVTAAYDFAAIGMTNVGRFQTYYANWGTGDQITYDNIAVTAIPEPATLGLVAVFGGGVLFIRRRFKS